MSVSVVIPCYNGADDIGEALESVLSQTACAQIAEIIVVDDGSEDDSARVIDAYAEKNEKLRYLYQENQGPSAARNRGIRASTQPYVAFLDADDVWLPRRIERQVKFMEAHPEVALVCADCYVEKEGREKRRVRCTPFGYKREDNLERLFVQGGPILMPSVLVRRACIVATGLFDESLPVAQDSDMWLRLAAAFPIHHLSVPVATVRKRAGSVASDAEKKTKHLRQVTHKAVAANPHLAALLNRRRAKTERYLGFSKLEEGDRKAAFVAALRSLRHDARNLRGYLLLLAAAAPSWSSRAWSAVRKIRERLYECTSRQSVDR